MVSESFNVKLQSLADTARLGKLIGEMARPGDVIILGGGLGAGKTTISQFIGAGLELPADCYITSPTYSLMHEYQGRLLMYHMDLYRLSSEEEVEDLGFLEYIYGEGLTVIEWPSRLGSLLPEEYLEILLGLEDLEDCRSAQISRTGLQWQTRFAKIRQLLTG